MTWIEILLLAVALAMDCFAVSMAIGVIMHRQVSSVAPRTALLFGLFQAAMPLLGWLATLFVVSYLMAYGKWIAFALLLWIGGKMIWESFHEEEAHAFNPRLLKVQLLLAVSTSIDALGVGVSFTALGLTEARQIAMPLIVIGLASWAFTLLGCHLGARFGHLVEKRLRPTLLGGIILLCIAIKIVLQS